MQEEGSTCRGRNSKLIFLFFKTLPTHSLSHLFAHTRWQCAHTLVENTERERGGGFAAEVKGRCARAIKSKIKYYPLGTHPLISNSKRGAFSQ